MQGLGFRIPFGRNVYEMKNPTRSWDSGQLRTLRMFYSNRQRYQLPTSTLSLMNIHRVSSPKPIERMLISENACLEFAGAIAFPTSASPNMQMNAPFGPAQATEARLIFHLCDFGEREGGGGGGGGK